MTDEQIGKAANALLRDSFDKNANRCLLTPQECLRLARVALGALEEQS